MTASPPALLDAPGSIDRRARAGSVAAGVSFLANLLSALVLVPVLIQAWGSERYGSWLALSSLVALVTTLDTGHHTYVGNELVWLYPTDRARARAMLAAGLLGAALLGGLELVVCAGLVLAGALPWALGQSEHALGVGLAPAFALWMLASVVQGSAGGVWARLYPAAGEYARSVWWGIAYRCLQTLVLGLAVWLGAGILGAVLATSATALAFSGVSWRDVRRRFADVYPSRSSAPARMALANLARSLVVTGCALVVQLQQHGVILLLSGRAGLALVPAFTTTRTLANVFLQAASVVTGPLGPEMVRLAALREHGKLAELVRAIWLVTGAPVHFGLCLGLPLYEPLYRAWTGGVMPFDAALFAWLALAVSLRALGGPLSALIAGVNALRAQVWIALVQSVLVLGVTWMALDGAGVAAAGLAVAIGELCGSVLLPLLLLGRISPDLMRRLPLRSVLLAAAPCALVGGALLGAARGALSAWAGLAVAAGLAALYWAQWSALGSGMRARLLRLARFAQPMQGAP